MPDAGAARRAEGGGEVEELVFDTEGAAGAEGDDGADAVVAVGEEEDAGLVFGAGGADVEGECGGANGTKVPPTALGPVAVDFGVADAASQSDAFGVV